MSTKGIVGTLGIFFDEAEGEGEPDEIEVASLVDGKLVLSTEMLQALDPDTYGWDYSVPGTKAWRYEGSMIQLVDTSTLERMEYLQRLEQSWFDSALLDFKFVSPTGAEYFGEGYIDAFELGDAFDRGYRGRFVVRGRGPLSAVELGDPDWCPDTLYYTNVWGLDGPSIYMGTEPGSVYVQWFQGADGTLRVFYNEEEILEVPNFVNFGTTEAWFDYDPLPGGPFTIRMTHEFIGPPLTPLARVVLWCPDQGAPPPEGEGEGEGEGE